MDDQRKARLLIKLGAAVGAIMTIVVALLMDVMYADALQGTWRDAIAKDLGKIFSPSITPDSFIVYIVFALVLALLGAIGAFMGVLFTAIVHRFLRLLAS